MMSTKRGELRRRARICYHEQYKPSEAETASDTYVEGYVTGYQSALKDVMAVVLNAPNNKDRLESLYEFMEEYENGD